MALYDMCVRMFERLSQAVPRCLFNMTIFNAVSSVAFYVTSNWWKK